MAQDMHAEEWDSATLTKLQVFEQYIHDWLNVVLNYEKNHQAFKTLEIYDLFCGSGYDGTKTHKGSPLRILDMLLKRNLKGKTIKVYFNDNDKNKINELQNIIQKQYTNLKSKNVEVKYTSFDTQDFKLLSKNYYKLVFLDQYGIQHINKINEFLRKGTDILIFISSGHFRRFLDEKPFQKYFNIEYISKDDFKGKSNYETHRVIAQYVKKVFPNSFIAPFSLIKDNNNINGLIFISTHQKGQEQFLKTAWKIDKDFGEGNKNIDKDYTKDKASVFYNEDGPSEKEKRYKELLKGFLQERRTNLEIKTFSLDNGFLTHHTNKILNDLKNELECEYCENSKRGFHLNEKNVKAKIRLKQ